MENRSGLVVDAEARHATGRAEVETALAMLERQSSTVRRRTALRQPRVVAGCRALGFTPHVAQNTSGRSSAIDNRTTRHKGYAEGLKKARMSTFTRLVRPPRPLFVPFGRAERRFRRSQTRLPISPSG